MTLVLEVVFHFVIHSNDNELLGDSSKGTILRCTDGSVSRGIVHA